MMVDDADGYTDRLVDRWDEGLSLIFLWVALKRTR